MSLSVSGTDVEPHVVRFLRPTSLHLKQHLDQFSRFFTAHPHAKHTDHPLCNILYQQTASTHSMQVMQTMNKLLKRYILFLKQGPCNFVVFSKKGYSFAKLCTTAISTKTLAKLLQCTCIWFCNSCLILSIYAVCISPHTVTHLFQSFNARLLRGGTVQMKTDTILYSLTSTLHSSKYASISNNNDKNAIIQLAFNMRT